MIVVDASVLANAIGDDGEDGRRARRELRAAADVAAPSLVDVETVAVLRKRWLAGTISERRFSIAVDDLEEIELDRYPFLPLMRRAFDCARTSPHTTPLTSRWPRSSGASYSQETTGSPMQPVPDAGSGSCTNLVSPR